MRRGGGGGGGGGFCLFTTGLVSVAATSLREEDNTPSRGTGAEETEHLDDEVSPEASFIASPAPMCERERRTHTYATREESG